ncbi:hypothetical protein CCACVL1_27425 [Corchorus capsularis]|uniref:Uncharacterized protein n=1 Tax=Corchorus capsularis TaxID=210143 RepID=A0A1R3GAC9_COCAP|nr:hypothetical protein CCACVL1_27425 [Corchorus capsularis]
MVIETYIMMRQFRQYPLSGFLSQAIFRQFPAGARK